MGRLGGTFDSETSASPRWSASLTVYDTLLSCLQVQNGGGENHDSKTTAFIQTLNSLEEKGGIDECCWPNNIQLIC